MHETLSRNIYCKNNLFITSTSSQFDLLKQKQKNESVACNFEFFDDPEPEIVPALQNVTWIKAWHDSYPNIPNKVNNSMRVDNSQRGKGTRKQDLGKRAGKFHILTNEFNIHNYGRNRLVFRKLQSVVSSVLIEVNDVRQSTLADRNIGASWNLTNLTFHSWRAGLVCWLRLKVVLDIYSAVVELLGGWQLNVTLVSEIKEGTFIW